MSTDNHNNDTQHLMSVVLNHYMKHHELVLKKLITAQQATLQSLDKISEFSTSQDPEVLGKVWQDIIMIFQDCGISEAELFTIEDIIRNIPKTIHDSYETLIEQDDSIQALIKEIEQSNYSDAMAQINEVQERPNPMTGLSREAFELSKEERSELHGGKAIDLTEARQWWTPKS